MVGLINYVMIYLLIGVAFMGFMDYTTHKMMEDEEFEFEGEYFTNRERISVILMWPISMYVFIKAFIKGE
jgi:hypothetical protein